MEDSNITESLAVGSDQRSLMAHLPAEILEDPDEILDRFLSWVSEVSFELYPAQEEAILELMAGRHVILNTPTGSGKSLVAQALHFKALCERRRCFYTSPIKALASEKFFDLCAQLGPENVGMMTGDASINAQAPIICCTAEVLSNLAIRLGPDLDAPYVVMDEFHYYADPERGVAWQVPLLVLDQTRFLLMSATLGNTGPIEERLRAQTPFEAVTVRSFDRPVPLDFVYRETPLHETIEDLHRTSKLPVYLVNFTQKDCAERAQALTSMQLTTAEEKKAIVESIRSARFDTPYGKEFRRFLTFGIGVHHAGLLPKYRLLVEQLSQQGLLKVISGTDTLGVGVNIPIRTVLFTQLCKFDGRKVSMLSVRNFQQIAGRAGRKGFDVQGTIVCQAPEHVIENKRMEQKAGGDGKKLRKLVKKKPPTKGFLPWDETTFKQLIERPPETLTSSFRVQLGMVLGALQRDNRANAADQDNFHTLRRLIERSHEDDRRKAELLGETARIVRSLHRAGIIGMVRDTTSSYYWVTINQALQEDFSLFHVLSLYLVEALDILEPSDEDFHLRVMTLVEAILESPRVILMRQVDKAKDDLMAKLRDEGLSYEERIERLEAVRHPQPDRDWLWQTFDAFAAKNPWVVNADLKAKSIAREIFENYQGFDFYVRHYGLQRSEGVLLRYLSQFYKTLDQTVPEMDKTDAVHEVLGYFRAMLERIDSSLIEEWEGMLDEEVIQAKIAHTEEHVVSRRERDLLRDPRAFRARVRAEVLQLVRALAEKDWEQAAGSVLQGPEESDTHWPPERFEAALEPFFARYQDLDFGPAARQAHWTRLDEDGVERWRVRQTLLDSEGDNFWYLEAEIDLNGVDRIDGPMIRLLAIAD